MRLKLIREVTENVNVNVIGRAGRYLLVTPRRKADADTSMVIDGNKVVEYFPTKDATHKLGAYRRKAKEELDSLLTIRQTMEVS